MHYRGREEDHILVQLTALIALPGGFAMALEQHVCVGPDWVQMPQQWLQEIPQEPFVIFSSCADAFNRHHNKLVLVDWWGPLQKSATNRTAVRDLPTSCGQCFARRLSARDISGKMICKRRFIDCAAFEEI
jgi:hypothetical protein